METPERILSEKNRPQYYVWAFINKKSELFLMCVGIFACFLITPVLLDPINDIPSIIKLLGFVTIYGFTVAMAIQPYLIYQKLRDSNWWANNK